MTEIQVLGNKFSRERFQRKIHGIIKEFRKFHNWEIRNAYLRFSIFICVKFGVAMLLMEKQDIYMET
jgi:predicted RNase H-like nuclease (RuvC/YqgF family)